METLRLSQPPGCVVAFGGRRYRLNLSFDNVMRVMDIQADTLFMPDERVALSLELLAGKRAARLPMEKQAALFKQIVDDFISGEKKSAQAGGPRVLDFIQDAPYIYAAFMQAYGIDLYEQHGRMDWRVFVALFMGLPEETKIREIMSIRAREVPVANKYNKKEIDALIKSKTYYALRMSEEDAESAFQAGIDRLAASLMARAKAGTEV